MRPMIKKGRVKIVKINRFCFTLVYVFQKAFAQYQSVCWVCVFEDSRSITENIGIFYLNSC